MGKVVKAFTGDKRAGEGAMQQSNALMERAVRELEKIGIPSIEAQQIVLQNPDLVLSSAEEKLGRSAMEDIESDQGLQGVQKQALQEMMQRGETGFTPEDIARFEAMREQVAGDEQARQQSILSSMAQRGALDSGAQLAQQLSSSQGAAQRAAQASRDIAGQASQARQGALSQAANMAQGMDAQSLALQGQKASAKDRIAEFNAAVAARDTGAKQAQAQNLAQTANQQQMYNKGLIQQNFQNQMAKATGMGSALGNQASGLANQAAMQANAAQQQAAGNRAMLQMVGSGVGKAMGMPMADGGIKYADGGVKYDDGVPKGNFLERGIESLGNAINSGLNNIGLNADNAIKLANRDETIDRLIPQLSQSKASLGEMRASEEGRDVLPKVNSTDKKLDTKKKTKNPMDALDYKTTPFQNSFKPQAIAYQPQQSNGLDAIRQQIMGGMRAADGGYKMAHEDGGNGTIIPGDSYAGDKLDDNINSKEMVTNLKQQNRINQLLLELKELKGGKRVDSMVQSGEAEVNPEQQEALMAVARGEKDVEELPEGNIVDPVDADAILAEILALLPEDEEEEQNG